MQEPAAKNSSSTPLKNEAAKRPGSAASFLLVLLQLVLVAVVVFKFNIERREQQNDFFLLLCVITGGFAIHAWLPGKYRIRFFAALSAASVLVYLGLDSGLMVLGIGGALIAVCYLPVNIRIRGAMLLAAAAGLALLRFTGANSLRLPVAPSVWPVLGSMFMFRLGIYIYDCRQAARRPPVAESVAYFFMVPNVYFPLFPVVDFRKFRESWYNEDEWRIYQRGVTWVVRGILHLLLYRYISSSLVPQPYALTDVRQVAVFMATNYALYLRVSGQFHLVTGLLHLFGFNLPRTHNQFFLASSFSDIWRRINIYWKDFMMKLFFFPTFHAVRRQGASLRAAIVLSVLCVFVCTWLLHSWQTFWLLGRFPVTLNEACLWLGVGICVAVNAVLDSRRGARAEPPAWRAALSLSLRIVAMFTLVSLFWACWTKPGFLRLLLGALERPGAGHGLLDVLLWLLAAVGTGTAFILVRKWLTGRGFKLPTLNLQESAILHAASLVLMVSMTSPGFTGLFSSETAKSMAAFRSGSAGDDERRLQGYYEDLNTAAIQAGPMMMSFSPNDETRREQAYGFLKVSRDADIYQDVELRSGLRSELNGNAFSVNQFGMRDRASITVEKPDRTVRIALVGSSIVMGYGVSDDDVFSRVFENRLNSERTDRTRRFEVLNFGVGRQWSTHRLVRMQRKVFGFDPDVIYYFAHQDEFQSLASHAAKLIVNGRELPSPYLADVARKAGVLPDMAEGAIHSQLSQHLAEMLAAVYETIVEDCRIRGIVPVWIYLPVPGSTAEDPAGELLPIARHAGFVVCDLSDWAAGHQPSDLFSATDGEHPNAEGHRLIADALMQMVKSRPETLPQVPVR